MRSGTVNRPYWLRTMRRGSPPAQAPLPARTANGPLYTSGMPDPKPRRVLNQIERELLGDKVDPEPVRRPRSPRKSGSRFLGVNEDASPLERALGPSCLLSLVIVALLLVAFRRLFSAPPTVIALIALVVFAVVLIILLRMRPLRIDNNDPHDR